MKIDSPGAPGYPEKPEKPSGGVNERSSGNKIEDSAILASSASSWVGSIMKKLDKARESIMGDDAAKKSEEEGAALDPTGLSHPEVYEKIKRIKDAGYSFYVQKYKEPDRPAGDGEVYRRYGDSEKQYFGLALKKGNECIKLPHPEEDLDLFSYFYLGDPSAPVKNPDCAKAIQKVYAAGNCFYDRYLEECFKHRPADALYTYSHAARLPKERDPQSDLHFKDGERFFQIESEADFKRACVLSGAMDKSSLSQDEAKALPTILDMLEKGSTFKERYGNSKFSDLDSLGNRVSGTRYYPVGPLAVMKGLRGGNTNLWLYKDNTRVPITDFLDVIDMFDKMEKMAGGETPPAGKDVQQEDGFVIIGGVRLPVHGEG